MLLPSDAEAHRQVGDIRDQIDLAVMISGRASAEALVDDIVLVLAMEKALQNAVEACLQLEKNTRDKGRFTRLFPDFDIDHLRRLANSVRHDYGNTRADFLLDELEATFLPLRDAAEALLRKKRR